MKFISVIASTMLIVLISQQSIMGLPTKDKDVEKPCSEGFKMIRGKCIPIKTTPGKDELPSPTLPKEDGDKKEKVDKEDLPPVPKEDGERKEKVDKEELPPVPKEDGERKEKVDKEELPHIPKEHGEKKEKEEVTPARKEAGKEELSSIPKEEGDKKEEVTPAPKEAGKEELSSVPKEDGDKKEEVTPAPKEDGKDEVTPAPKEDGKEEVTPAPKEAGKEEVTPAPKEDGKEKLIPAPKEGDKKDKEDSTDSHKKQGSCPENFKMIDGRCFYIRSKLTILPSSIRSSTDTDRFGRPKPKTGNEESNTYEKVPVRLDGSCPEGTNYIERGLCQKRVESPSRFGTKNNGRCPEDFELVSGKCTYKNSKIEDATQFPTTTSFETIEMTTMTNTDTRDKLNTENLSETLTTPKNEIETATIDNKNNHPRQKQL